MTRGPVARGPPVRQIGIGMLQVHDSQARGGFGYRIVRTGNFKGRGTGFR